MKTYISGKITGDPKYREKFQTAKENLEKLGHIVLNPAQLPEGMTATDYMRVNFAMIDVADIVVFLPDWRDSKGARLEHAYCEYIGKQMIFTYTKKPSQEYAYLLLDDIADTNKVPCSRR